MISFEMLNIFYLSYSFVFAKFLTKQKVLRPTLLAVIAFKADQFFGILSNLFKNIRKTWKEKSGLMIILKT
jgi:hypothetical protein